MGPLLEMGSQAPSFKEAAAVSTKPWPQACERERWAQTPCAVTLLNWGQQVLNLRSEHQQPSAPEEAASSLLLTFSGRVLTNRYVLQEGYCWTNSMRQMCFPCAFPTCWAWLLLKVNWRQRNLFSGCLSLSKSSLRARCLSLNFGVIWAEK